jgi:hypothetical protein
MAKKAAKKVHPPTVRGKEVWAQKEPPKEMVWAVCPYTRSAGDGCLHCPTWQKDKTYGPVQRGCYGMAAEACRVVFAMQAR